MGTPEQNLAKIDSTMALAASRGVELCVFPELSITGYRGQHVLGASKEETEKIVQTICQRCKELQLAVVLCSLLFEGDNRYNGLYFINDQGEIIGTVIKHGLTESEEKAFAKTECRPTVELKGVKISAMICREVIDYQTLSFDDSPDLVIWTSYIGEMEGGSQNTDFQDMAQQFCQHFNLPVVQANWGKNRDDVTMQGSSAYQANGDVVATLEQNSESLMLLEFDGQHIHLLEVLA
jgi:predicted amidohydrolase